MQRAPSHSLTQRGSLGTVLPPRSLPASPRSSRVLGARPSAGQTSRLWPLSGPWPPRTETGELRFAIQNKHLCHRMSSALESVTINNRPLELAVTKAEVAPEEDERKRRRRERNKIAAAKCRNKKKEKTECLQKESEKLESVNAELKAQIEELKNEKQHLIYMLNLHRPTCIVRAQNGRTPEDERNLFIQQIKEGTLQS
ncbi:cyclic AMP-dependent transcription factor ATF-3 isoform X1 [Microtus oregoni]|uniref:cyclic AMP-dependent transcription factor ATF-3 isoform X1 n=1 Tax=Microtus oregoni TaxID=111838 RepID=UPI001BB12F9C|nr:cyclic AMP-dependent transcription factor ATF-3 isoform X1 [Microtus oregoni]